MGERVRWIDIAKGYGIMLVVAGHLGIPYFGIYITSFHLPLFFMLAGVTFSSTNKGFGEFFKKKMKSLLVPYFCLGVPLIISSFVTRLSDGENIYEISDYLYVIWQFLLQRRMYTIWFLMCLFLLEIIFYLIAKILNYSLIKMGIASIIMGVLGVVYFKIVGITLPFNIDACFTAMPFFYLGYVMKNERFQKNLFDLPKIYVLLFIIINLVCVTGNKYLAGENLNMATNEYGFVPLTFIAAVSGIACVLLISKWFPINIVQYLGKRTLVYFAWHQSIAIPMLLFIFDILKLFKNDTIISDGIRDVVLFLMIFILLAPVDIFIRRTRLRVILGLKKTN